MVDTVEPLARADALIPRAGGLFPPPSVLVGWPAPNYQNPEDRGWAGSIVMILVLAITCATFLARIWARMSVSKNPGLDDLLMSIAMVPLIGLTVASVLGNRIYGFQWHAWDQTRKTFVTSRQITLAIEILYIVSTSFIKISILCFYRRITNGSISKTFVYWVWGLIVFVILYCIIFVLIIVFSCKPIEGFWHLFDIPWRLTNEVKCNDEAAGIVSVVIISTVQDFICAILPVFLVWNLQISKRQKAALIGIFALGLLTCVCGILRTYYAIYVYYRTYDITWYANVGWVWTAVEADLGVICASAPALKVFFRRYFNLSANRSAAYGTGRKTPTWSKQKDSHASPWSTSHSITTSTRGDNITAVPLDRIHVSTGMGVTVEDRDDALSQRSFASTRELTALPTAAQPAKSISFEKYLNVKSAFRSDTNNNAISRTESIDLERDGGSK
ncbi:hypothetical protein BCR34DRAFT_106096 [Clohesyomyces aquaticus]|uniref:Rhodopsin domain-containing protein n=1 Tax=Clohesyomyces aquaticus TaxID=1231657 RepID=A0A1Y2A1L3_9PLEO|nr:hypothetical protein BCR34DRAFT_106096 [Clohesyomyces aquaticus]